MDKLAKRKRRKKSIKKKVYGTPERPRMCVHKSNRTIYVQIVNDIEGKTICGVSTGKLSLAKGKSDVYTRKNMNFAKELGGEIAKIATEKGVTKIVFDRAGYKYHGTVKAIADAARKNGLQF